VLDYQYGDDARQGATDIIISLTPEEVRRLGVDAAVLADWFDTALWVLARLRNGHEMTAQDWHTAINDLDHRLLPRIEGIRDAVIRAHAAAGGSVGDLALAMDVPRSTAQYRREVLLAAPPGLWESWALSGGPE